MTLGANQTASATTATVTVSGPGAYCFKVTFINSDLQTSKYSNTSHTNSLPGATAGGECLILASPSAFTLSSMSAQSVDSGMGWAMLGLGTLGSVTLGALLFIIARKR